MPRRELTEAERYLREADDLRRREQQLSEMRDRAARELGMGVLEAGGASLSPEQLRSIVREAVAASKGLPADLGHTAPVGRKRRTNARVPSDANGASASVDLGNE